jgi:glutamate racemase
VSVLGTEATVAREYTRALIRDYAQGCAVTLVGSTKLATFAEAELRGEAVPDAAIRPEIEPCFRDDGGARTDTVVLACTHYPLLLDRFGALSPWPVSFIDPAPAIARRVRELLGPATTARPGPARVIFTSGRRPPPALATALAGFGLSATAGPHPDADPFDTSRVSS